MTQPVDYLTTPEAAAFLRLAPRTLLAYRKAGGGPSYVRAGARRVIYARTELDRWLVARSFPHRAAEVTR